MNRPNRWLVVGVLVFLILAWGTTWAAIRIGLRGVPPFTGVALRFAISSLVLLAIAPFLGVRFGRSRRELGLWTMNGILSFSVSYGVVYWSEQVVPSGLAATLFATFPLLVALLAHFMLPGERIRPGVAAGMLIGFAGVATIFSEDLARLGGPGVAFACAVLLISPVVSAVSNVAIKKWGQGIHPVSLSAVSMGIGSGIMGAVALSVERGATLRWNGATAGALLYLAIVGSALTFTLYYWLMTHYPATHVSLIAYATPVVAVAVGVLFMNEPVTPRVLAGSALVVIGVAAATRR